MQQEELSSSEEREIVWQILSLIFMQPIDFFVFYIKFYLIFC